MGSTFETLHEWRGEKETLHHYAGWFDLTNYNPSFEFADGGFVTTAQDLARFGIAFSRKEIFTKKETFIQFLSPQERLQGHERFRALGPQVEYTEDGTRLFFHAGSWGVRFIVSPEQEAVAVIVLGQANAKTHRFWADARAFIADLF
jgi:CubicO group peptidase (beta-lactamase class C family)